jgi:Sulfotransferase family
MLRDALAGLPVFCTWPCDEINAIWRYGNTELATDELTPEHARPEVARYIRRRFLRLAQRRGGSTVVEKTCANSLRVPFVNTVLPEARYVYLVRDGRDVVASAMERWRGGFQPLYLARKLRFVPLCDLPHYAFRFGASRLRQLRSPDRRQRSWGPRFLGIDEISAQEPLDVVCARQWQASVRASDAAFSHIDHCRVLYCRYEEFVRDPSAWLARIAALAGKDATAAGAARACAHVAADRPATWQRRLSPAAIARVTSLLEPELRRHGYA